MNEAGFTLVNTDGYHTSETPPIRLLKTPERLLRGYLADNGGEPIPLGSLRKGESRVVSMKLADRHVLIAEQRQMPQGVARKFTPTLNAWTGHAFVHGFIQRSDDALRHRGSVVEPYGISTIMADV